MAPFGGGEGPLTLISDLEAGGLVAQGPPGGRGMGSKLGLLPVDGASGDYLYSGIPPTAGLCTVLCDCVLFAILLPLLDQKGRRAGSKSPS